MQKKHRVLMISILLFTLVLILFLTNRWGISHSMDLSKNDFNPLQSETSFYNLAKIKEFSQREMFSSKGTIEAIIENSSSSGCTGPNGYYRFIPREDCSSNLCYIDYSSCREIYLCNQPNCTHSDNTCPAWYPSNLGILLAIPVGNRVAIIHGGSPDYAEIIGESALAQIEIVDADGTNRKSLITFPANIQISNLPRGGYARDSENVYFVLTLTLPTATLRSLCALNVVEEKIYSLYDLSEDEEKIIGALDNELLLSYSPNSYDISYSANDLKTNIICLDSKTENYRQIVSHPYLSICGLDSHNYYVLSPQGELCTYSLNDGAASDTLQIAFPDGFDSNNMHSDGFFDGKLLVHSYNVSAATEGPSPLVYCAIDVKTGSVTNLTWTYSLDELGFCACSIAAEVDENFMVRIDQHNQSVTLPSGEEVSYPIYQYAMVEKNSYWNNETNNVQVISCG